MLQSAEVIEVILTDNDPGHYSIRFRFLDRASNNDENTEKALPLNAHIKSIPVPGEIVLIVTGASSFAGNLRTSGAKYYINDINIQSSINYNGVPTAGNVPISNATNYRDAFLGVTSAPKQTQPDRIKKTFKPVNGINPLQLFEGDIVLEGRSGNSIRLSSTVTGVTSITKQPTWTLGNPGDPILIISNTKKNTAGKGFRIEDINKDDSSIYLTSTQRVPLTLAGPATVTNIKIGAFTQNLSGKQIIMSSDRIVLNAKENELALSSKNGISITTKGDIVLESSNEITLDAANINLGYLAKYSAVNGETLKDILTEVITAVNGLTGGSLSNAQALLLIPAGNPNSLLSSTVKL